MDIASRSEGGCLVVEVRGRLDAAAAPELDDFCTALIDGGSRKLEVDLTHLDYISSAGPRALLAAAKRLGDLDGGLALANPTGLVKTVLTVSGLGSMVPIEKSLEEARTEL